MINFLESYGSPELSGWRVENLSNGKAVFWIQTTSRRYARKLRKRKDTKQVGVTGFNHFRETLELRGTWTKIKRIIDHYILSAGDQFSGVDRPLIALRTNDSHFIPPRSKCGCRPPVKRFPNSQMRQLIQQGVDV